MYMTERRDQVIVCERSLTPAERKQWTAGVVRVVGGNALTTAIVLMLESCEINDGAPIELSHIDWGEFNLVHREIIAGCKKLQSFSFVTIERVHPSCWRARLRLPDWPPWPNTSLE